MISTDFSRAVRAASRALALVLPLAVAAPASAQLFGASSGSSIPGSGGGSSFGFNNFGSLGFLSCGFLPDPDCELEVDIAAEIDEGEVTGFSLQPLDDLYVVDEVLMRFRNKDERFPAFGISEDLDTVAASDPDGVTVSFEVLESNFEGGSGSDPTNLDFVEVADGIFDITIVVPDDADNRVNGTVEDIEVDETDDTITFIQTSDWIFRFRVSVNSPVNPVGGVKSTGNLCWDFGTQAPIVNTALCDPNNPNAQLGFFSVPEPAPLALLGIGLGALGLGRRRHARAA